MPRPLGPRQAAVLELALRDMCHRHGWQELIPTRRLFTGLRPTPFPVEATAVAEDVESVVRIVTLNAV